MPIVSVELGLTIPGPRDYSSVRASVATGFWQRVDRNGDGCWLWRNAPNSHGYGFFYFNGSKRQAHRFAYELLVEPIPLGLTIDHLCRNRRCVNPEHMEVVTRKENILRGEGISARNARKKRCVQGHLFNTTNTYLSPYGSRRCRVCHRMWKVGYRQKQKLESNYAASIY